MVSIPVGREGFANAILIASILRLPEISRFIYMYLGFTSENKEGWLRHYIKHSFAGLNDEEVRFLFEIFYRGAFTRDPYFLADVFADHPEVVNMWPEGDSIREQYQKCLESAKDDDIMTLALIPLEKMLESLLGRSA